jgi:hypothetical protein
MLAYPSSVSNVPVRVYQPVGGAAAEWLGNDILRAPGRGIGLNGPGQQAIVQLHFAEF